MSVLAVDIGTSNIKAVIAGRDGRLLEVRSTRTPTRRPRGGGHGFSAGAVRSTAMALIAGLAGARPRDRVDTVVFSCLGTAMVPLDRGGDPLGPALSPADARPSREGPLPARLGIDAGTLRRLTGSEAAIASSLLHWLWWRDARPELARRTHRLRSLRGFLVEALCGADAEDRSWASRTMLFDLETDDWSDDILAAARLPRHVLPTVRPSTASWGIHPRVAARLGLRRDARVVLGAMDNCCSFLGASDPAEPRLVNIVGTYEHVAGVGRLADVRAVTEAAGGLVHAYAVEGEHIAMTREPMGLCLARLGKAGAGRLDRLLDGISEVPLGRTIEVTEAAVLEALDRGEQPADVLQALLEGSVATVARFADAWQRMTGASPRIVAVGGGARRERALRLKATLLGRPIATLASEEGAGLGALRLAAMAVGGLSPADAVERFPNPVVRTLEPAARRRLAR